jgi:acetyl esterase/lipase
MASPQVESLKALLMALREEMFARDEPPTLEEMRESSEMFGALTGEPDGVRWEDAEVGGRPCRWAIPDGGADDRVLQYVHGGGYVVGSLEGYRKLTGHLARALGCRVLSVDYRLAPEHPHPAAVEDSTSVYRALLADVAPHHLAIAGDSAGGGLTVATLLKLRDESTPLPAGGVPMSPWVDLEGTGESMRTKADVDLIVGHDALKQMADLFLAGADAHDPYAAPLHADLRGLPPLYIQVGGDETLLDDATRLAARAAAAGVEVRLDSFPEMQHVFQLAAGAAPEADDAVARIGHWLRPRLGL